VEWIFEAVDHWVQKGFFITYDIIDQEENGYAENTKNQYTYTFYIHKADEELFAESVDDLLSGYGEVLKFLTSNH